MSAVAEEHPSDLLPTREEIEELRRQAEEDPQAGLLDLANYFSRGGEDGRFDGQRYICNRLAKLPDAMLDAFEEDPELFEEFVLVEKERVSDPVTGFYYFLLNYGSHFGASGQGREALEPWGYQIDKLAPALLMYMLLVVPKSRRVGLTLIVCHYAVWRCCFCADTPSFRVLALSSGERTAMILLLECKEIIRHLPTWLRPELEVQSTTRLTFKGRDGAFIQALPASEEAARSFTASMLILDEFARLKGKDPREIYLAAKPTIEGGGQVVAISTGGGRVGVGEKFAELVDGAKPWPSVGTPWHPINAEEYGPQILNAANRFMQIFVSWHERPGRDQDWYDAQLADLGPDKAKQEYPSNVEEALSGDADDRGFNGSHLQAARELGRKWDKIAREGQIVPVGGRGIVVGQDWGKHTATVLAYPIPGDSWYIAREWYSVGVDPEEHLQGVLDDLQRDGVPIKEYYHDSAGNWSGQAALLDRLVKARYGHWGVKVAPIVFSEARLRTLTYIRRLLWKTAEGHQSENLAISESCPTLLKQMGAIESKENGDLAKDKFPDHLIDAMICALAEASARHVLSRGIG